MRIAMRTALLRPSSSLNTKFGCCYSRLPQGLPTLTGAPKPVASLSEPTFLAKLAGDPAEKSPSRPSVSHVVVSTATAFTGLGAVAVIHCFAPPELEVATQLIPSFGSSVIVLFGYPSIPFSQPRHVIGGHFFSAASGLIVAEAIVAAGLTGSVAAAVAAPASVAVALGVMMLTKTMHPPVRLHIVWVFVGRSLNPPPSHLQAGGTAMIAAGLGAGSGGVGSISASFLLTRALDTSRPLCRSAHPPLFSFSCMQLSSAALSHSLRSQPLLTTSRVAVATQRTGGSHGFADCTGPDEHHGFPQPAGERRVP